MPLNFFSKYEWVASLKDKNDITKVLTTVNLFHKILDSSTRKSNKIWGDKGSEFYNKSFKK